MTVSIWAVAPPPYEQYLYVSYGTFKGNVGVYVWPATSGTGPIILHYPAADRSRALKEIDEFSALVISTRRLLGLETPTLTAQAL